MICRTFRLCKCAIFLSFLNPQAPHRSGNFPQAQLRNIAGGKAEGVGCTAGVEAGYIAEVLGLQIILRVNAAAGEKHICHAVLEGCVVFHIHIEIVQFLQKAALAGIHQIAEVVGHIVQGDIFRR